MYYYYLSMLKDVLTEEQCDKLGEYFCSLTPNTRDLITVSKTSKSVGISSEVALQVLNKCEEVGYLKRQYGIRCPECDTLVKMISTEIYNTELSSLSFTCYDCDKSFKADDNNVIVFYKLIIDVSPFAIGQRKPGEKNKQDIESLAFVAPEDSLAFQKKIAESLEIIAKNQEHEHEYRRGMVDGECKNAELESVAIQKYKRNKWIALVISVAGYLFLSFIIIWVYKKYGYDKISVFVTFGTSLMAFIFNYIVYSLFPKDIDLIKRLLKNKKSNV